MTSLYHGIGDYFFYLGVSFNRKLRARSARDDDDDDDDEDDDDDDDDDVDDDDDDDDDGSENKIERALS